MAKPKLPKRPKQSASIATLENHLKSVRATEAKFKSQLAAAKKVVAAKKAEVAKRKALNEVITKERAAYSRMK